LQGSSIDYLSIKRASHAKNQLNYNNNDRYKHKFSIKVGRIDSYIQESKYSLQTDEEFKIPI